MLNIIGKEYLNFRKKNCQNNENISAESYVMNSGNWDR